MRLVVEALSKTEVEEAKSPHVPLPLNHSGVVVDCTLVPKLVSVVVHGQVMPAEKVEHPKTPPLHVSPWPPPLQAESMAPYKAVVDAVPTVTRPF